MELKTVLKLLTVFIQNVLIFFCNPAPFVFIFSNTLVQCRPGGKAFFWDSNPSSSWTVSYPSHPQLEQHIRNVLLQKRKDTLLLAKLLGNSANNLAYDLPVMCLQCLSYPRDKINPENPRGMLSGLPKEEIGRNCMSYQKSKLFRFSQKSVFSGFDTHRAPFSFFSPPPLQLLCW